jgi:hypothetical protein
MRKTFDWIESIINPVARGPIYPITQKSIPDIDGGGRLYQESIQKVQGWNLDPISGTFSRLSPDQYNPDSIQAWPFGKAGMFPEKGQVPRVLEIPVSMPILEVRRAPCFPDVGSGKKVFTQVFITSPETRINPTGIYQGFQVNGNN